MGKRIGLIQTRGIGDIVIAIPIADAFLQEGYDVIWPIDQTLVSMFSSARPDITFPGVPMCDGYFFDAPLKLLQERDCERIIPLYNFFDKKAIYDERLAHSLKFDEYKYAVAGVPFSRKWNLKIHRNQQREEDLYRRVNPGGEYVCLHDSASNFRLGSAIPTELIGDRKLVRIEPLTDNPFDWLLTLERASRLILIDSCFSNLVEQLNFPNEKYLILRSPMKETPIYKNGWKFLYVTQIETIESN